MASPPRLLRRSPPRRALHERSESHANEITAPTLRVIGDSDAQIYASSPFPSHPSQILSPKGVEPGVKFEDGVSVSYEDNSMGASALGAERPSPLTISKGKAPARPLSPDDDETRSEIPTFDIPASIPAVDESLRRTQEKFDQILMDEGIDDDERLSDEIIQLPSVSNYRDGRAETLDTPPLTPNIGYNSSSEAIGSETSHNSLYSADSNGTVVRRKIRNRGSYSAFPPVARPTSSRSGRSFSTPVKPNPNLSRDSLSLISSSFSTPDRRVSSLPTYTILPQADDDNFTIQYPIVRPPTISGSWAESSFSSPKRPTRMSDHNGTERWNPHLSTVQSEETDEKSSTSIAMAEPGLPSNTSSWAIDNSATALHLYPPANAPRARSRDTASSSIRVVSESGDDLGDLPSPPLRSPGSAFFNALSKTLPVRDSQSRGTQAGLGSRGSFLRDSIPSWARNYYANRSRDTFLGASSEAAESRPETSVSAISANFSRHLYNHRNRPREIDTNRTNLDSMPITPAANDDDNDNSKINYNDNELVAVRGSPRRKISGNWSPHLRHDRRSIANRRSLFIAPSIDEQAEGDSMSRRNVQVVLFVLGFIFPLAWMLASFLSLPAKPHLTPPGSSTTPNIAHDIEKALDPIDQAQYESARWWRNVNRIMSVMGLLIIIAIIILVVLAARMQK